VLESEVEVSTDATPWDYFHPTRSRPAGRQPADLRRSTWAATCFEAVPAWVSGAWAATAVVQDGPGTRDGLAARRRMLANGELTFFDDGSNPPILHPVTCAADQARLSTQYGDLSSASPTRSAAAREGQATCRRSRTGSPRGPSGVPGSAILRRWLAALRRHLPYDQSFYRAFRFPWTARADPPAVLASLNNTRQEEIITPAGTARRSRLVAGPGGRVHGSLTVRAIPASGSRARPPCPRKYARVACRRSTTAGHPLGVSSPLR